MKRFFLLLSYFLSLQAYSQTNTTYTGEIETTIVVSDNSTKIYQSPNLDATIVGYANKGDSFKTISFYKGKPAYNLIFYKVLYNDKEVYLSEGYINDFRKHRLLVDNIINKQIKYSDSIKIANADLLRAKMEREQDSINELKNKELIENLIIEARVDSIMKNECYLTRDDIDPFDSTIVKKLLAQEVADGLFIELDRVNDSYYIKFYSDLDLGCVSPYSNNKSYVKIKLYNGDILTFYHIDDIDCSEFILTAKVLANEIVRLKKSKIKIIRLQGTKYFYDYEYFDFDEFFIKKFKCLK